MMKKRICILCMTMMMIPFLFACNDQETKKEQEATTTEAVGQQETTTEKKDDTAVITDDFQTLLPEEGETIAIFHIKDYGEIRVKFFPEDSPLAVENFLTLAEDGYYDGLIFHRVIADFMIQTGDPTGTGLGGESKWGEDFKNEYSDRLRHINGSLGMARTAELDTNGSQFFINCGVVWPEEAFTYYQLDEKHWDAYTTYGGNPHLQDDYTVFGQVYEGMDIVAAICGVDTDENDKPLNDVVIESIEVTEYKK